MIPPTAKQVAVIEDMERILNVKFTGKNIKEAVVFISQHMERYREGRAFIFEMIHNENNY